MLTKTQQIDNITVDANNIVHVRTATLIVEDGAELSRTYHRNTLSPGDDLSEQDPRVVAVASAVWTPEVVAAHLAKTAEPTTP
jgi:hypothetical protein